MLQCVRPAVLFIAAWTTVISSAHAQSWPTRPIKMILPFGGGGPGESLMRPMVEHLQKVLGQAVIVENRPGAGGTTGAAAVAKADPDGYTLLYGTNSPFSVGPVVYAKAGYTAAAFVPIALVYQAPFVVSASTKSGVNSVAELVAAAKRTPEAFSFASVGLATTTHLLAELINLKSGTRIAHVPYRGPGPAMADLIGGQVQMFVDGISNMAPQHDSGAIKALMVLDAKRAATLPTVPTSAEAGYPGMIAHLWAGIAAPAGTPREIIELLNREINIAIDRPDLKANVAKLGLEVKGGPPQRLADRISQETLVWRQIAEQARVRID